MITETGKNLSVLILTETEMDWQTFATWYSIFKNLPDADISVICYRNSKAPFEYFQWIKRLKIPSIRRKQTSDDPIASKLWAIKLAQQNEMISDEVLMIDPLTMALRTFDQNVLEIMAKNDLNLDETAWFLRRPNIDEMLNNYLLEDKIEIRPNSICFDAKDTNNSVCLTSYRKGCGKWINTSTGCPLSNAAGLVSTEMTINETRIIELWQKMVPIYYATK